MVTRQHLEAFLDVVEHGSLKAAAEATGRRPPDAPRRAEPGSSPEAEPSMAASGSVCARSGSLCRLALSTLACQDRATTLYTTLEDFESGFC